MSQSDLHDPALRLQMPARRRALFAARDAAVAAAALPTLPALAAAQPAAQAAVALAELRVMHGFADQQSVTFWLQARQALRLRVDTVRTAAAAGESPQQWPVTLDALADCSAQLRITDLEPGSSYRYLVYADGQAAPLASGSFRTQVLWQHRSDPPTLRIAVGSCAYLNDGRFDRPGTPYGGGEEIFDTIAATTPDLMLWLGDNIYLREPEWTSREGINKRYRFYREHASLRKLLSATSHVAIWDDHDFGPNDADGSFVNKAWTREMFNRYWPSPYPQPAEGQYGMVSVGDVDIFMLDDRSHRYPDRWPAGPDKVMYGATQINWLQRALVASRARFKLIAGGSQFFNRASRFDCWMHFPAEEQAMRRWLEQQKIPGVIFLSGDRHFAEMFRIERPGTYPLYELTTSPLTSSPVRKPDDAERNNPDLVPGTFYNERNFAMLTVTGPRTDRVLAIELRDTQGRKLWDVNLKASALV